MDQTGEIYFSNFGAFVLYSISVNGDSLVFHVPIDFGCICVWLMQSPSGHALC